MEFIDSTLFALAVFFAGLMGILIVCLCIRTFYRWMRSFDGIDRMRMAQEEEDGPWFEHLNNLDNEGYQKFLDDVAIQRHGVLTPGSFASHRR